MLTLLIWNRYHVQFAEFHHPVDGIQSPLDWVYQYWRALYASSAFAEVTAAAGRMAEEANKAARALRSEKDSILRLWETYSRLQMEEGPWYILVCPPSRVGA